MSGAGAGVSSSADQFTFVYRKLTGDGTIVARVNNLQNTNPSAKAGIMLRNTLAAGSRNAYLLVSASQGLAFQRRRRDDRNTVSTAGSGSGPVWLRLQRRVSTITASWSPDGVTWTTLGSDSIAMDGPIYVGVAVTSQTEVAATMAGISNVQVTSLAESGLPLPGAWQSADVGGPGQPGAAAHDSGAYGLMGSGDISGTSDRFHFAYRTVDGDYEISARVRAIGDVNALSRAGVMIRESLTASAPHAAMLLSFANGTQFQRRAAPAGSTASTQGTPDQATVWVKLTVRNGVAVAHQSLDGAAWTLVGTETLTLPSPYYIGLAVTSADDTANVVANIDDVRVRRPPATTPPSVALSAPLDGEIYAAPATMGVSAAASDTDGTVARVDFYAGSTLVGSATSSPYSMTWSNVPAGSYSVTAVAIDDAGATTTSAARSVTVSAPAANQPPTVSLTAPANGASYTAPATISISAAASDTDGTVAKVDFYRGTTLIGTDTSSPYSVTWSNAGAGTYSLTAVATDNAGATATSAARSITVTGLPAGWTAADVGSPTPAGRTTYTNGTFAITAGGSDIWFAADQFHFAYQQFTGDVDVVARVGSLGTTNPWSKAGVMVRGSLAGNAVHASMFTSPGNGMAFQRRTATGGQSEHTAGGASQAPVWVKLSRRGSTVTALHSPDGVTWTTVGSVALTLPTQFYVGLAVTSHDSTRTVDASFDNVVVQAPAGNQAPTASLTAPANGATFTAPASITVSANASDLDGTIARVDFYSGSALIGSDTSSPYSITWSNVQAGSYSLTAVATDNGGATATSAARTVTVSAPANQLPTAALTAPADGATYVAPATITITATASDPDGTVAKVDFYRGTTLIGTDTSSPYSVTWSNAGAGTYSLTAVATDNAGATATSAARSITVTGLPAGWTAADVGSPTPAGRTTYTNGTFAITAGGSDIWFAADQFHFAYQQFTGDVDVVARVGSLGTTNPWSKAGVMVRGSLAGNAVHASMFTSPSNGMAFQRRTVTGGQSEHTAGGASQAPVWVKLSRRGSTVTASHSPDGVTWTMVGSVALTLPTQFYVGLAVTSHDSTRTVDASFDSVVVQAPTGNQAPSVALTAPASGATFTAPASITVSATASDTDGSIARVDFFAGSTLIGTDTSSPYSITWSNVAAGSYSLTAVATDNAGAAATSAARSVNVTPAANQPPTVALTAPADGASYTAPATITITATASDPDGSIAKVDFYRGSTLIGTDTSSPYSVTWSSAPAGSYSLTAVATDNAGTAVTSAARTVVVNGTSTQRNAIFAPSADHNTMVISYRFEVFAAGANTSTATPIATRDLGKPPVVNGEITADVTTTVNALAAGSYQATVSSVGSGGSSRSAPATFTR